jgi:hypothetical protein
MFPRGRLRGLDTEGVQAKEDVVFPHPHKRKAYSTNRMTTLIVFF